MSEWGLDYNGGPHHAGKCTKCGEENGSCNDEICEHCASLEPRKCPKCGCSYSWTEFTESGICTMCAEVEAESLTI